MSNAPTTPSETDRILVNDTQSLEVRPLQAEVRALLERVATLEAAALFAHTRVADYLRLHQTYSEEPLVAACQRLYAALSPQQKRERA